MDTGKVAVGDVVLLPMIIALVQAVKRFFPTAQPALWFGLAFVFGVLGQTVVFLIAHGESWAGWDMTTWSLCVVSGLAFGLAAGKAYDVAKDGI